MNRRQLAVRLSAIDLVRIRISARVMMRRHSRRAYRLRLVVTFASCSALRPFLRWSGKLRCRLAVDGEVVILHQSGRSDFHAVKRAISLAAEDWSSSRSISVSRWVQFSHNHEA